MDKNYIRLFQQLSLDIKTLLYLFSKRGCPLNKDIQPYVIVDLISLSTGDFSASFLYLSAIPIKKWMNIFLYKTSPILHSISRAAIENSIVNDHVEAINYILNSQKDNPIDFISMNMLNISASHKRKEIFRLCVEKIEKTGIRDIGRYAMCPDVLLLGELYSVSKDIPHCFGSLEIMILISMEETCLYDHIDTYSYLLDKLPSCKNINIVKVLNHLMIMACNIGTLDVVKYALERGANIHYKHDTALVTSCVKGYDHIVLYLLQKGEYSDTCLEEIIGSLSHPEKNHNLKYRRSYYQTLADMNRINYKDYNPRDSIEEYYREKFPELYIEPINPLIHEHRFTFYSHFYEWKSEVALDRYVKIIKYLLSGDKDLSSHKYILSMWADTGKTPIIELLLDLGYDVKNDDRVLITSVNNNHIKMAKLLISRGADVNIKNGLSMLLAIKNGNMEMIQLLLSNGYNIHLRNDDIILHTIIRRSSTIFTLWVELGMDIHSHREKFFIYSVEHAFVTAMRIFVAIGVDVNCRDNYAIKYAGKYGRPDVIAFLVIKGAHYNLIDDTENRLYAHNIFLRMLPNA